jgi:hypothetical protein
VTGCLKGQLLIAVIAATVLTVRCAGANDTTSVKEVQRLRSGALDVVLLSPTGSLRRGKDTFVIEFRSATDGSLLDVGDVRVTASMAMSGTQMPGTVAVTSTGVRGRYAAESQLSMAGTWRLPIEWNGPAGKGSVTFSSAVQ